MSCFAFPVGLLIKKKKKKLNQKTRNLKKSAVKWSVDFMSNSMFFRTFEAKGQRGRVRCGWQASCDTWQCFVHPALLIVSDETRFSNSIQNQRDILKENRYSCVYVFIYLTFSTGRYNSRTYWLIFWAKICFEKVCSFEGKWLTGLKAPTN